MLAKISRDELKEKIGTGSRFVLIEALPAFMYEQGHLPGAKNVPPDQVRELAPKVAPDKSVEVVVYCGGPT